jgi:hypothetical protein
MGNEPIVLRALGYPKLFHNGNDTFVAWGNPKHVETASLAKKD